MGLTYKAPIVEGTILTVDTISKERRVEIFPFVGYMKTVERLLITIKTNEGEIFTGETNIMTLKVGDEITVKLQGGSYGAYRFQVISKRAGDK